MTVLGLSYKPDRPVIEESQGIALASYLSGEGYLVTTYDPLAIPAAEAVLTDRVHFARSLSKAVAAAHAIVITISWPEFMDLPFDKNVAVTAGLAVIDPWRIVDESKVPKGARIVHLGRSAQPADAQPALRVVSKSS